MVIHNEDPSELGQQFFYGVGRKKSYRLAFPYLLKAAKLNDPHCQNFVGYCYARGLGVEKDIRLALFWYRYAAANDDKEALRNLALRYKKGDGLRPARGKHSRCTKQLPNLVMLGHNAFWELHTLKALVQSEIQPKQSDGHAKQHDKEMTQHSTIWAKPTSMGRVCGKIRRMRAPG